jgi:hypothetical protein
MITFIFREWDKSGDIFERWRMGNAQIKSSKQIKKRKEEKKPPVVFFFKWKNQLKKQKLW